MPPCTIGIDYGTNSVRAVVVNTRDGHELGSGVVDYPSGKHGILLDARDHHDGPSSTPAIISMGWNNRCGWHSRKQRGHPVLMRRR